MAKDAAFRRVKDEDDFRIRFQELQAQVLPFTLTIGLLSLASCAASLMLPSQASDPVERNYVLGRFRALREAMVVQHRQVDQLTREGMLVRTKHNDYPLRPTSASEFMCRCAHIYRRLPERGRGREEESENVRGKSWRGGGKPICWARIP